MQYLLQNVILIITDDNHIMFRFSTMDLIKNIVCSGYFIFIAKWSDHLVASFETFQARVIRFETVSQNVLISDLKKSRICPIWSQYDSYWSET